MNIEMKKFYEIEKSDQLLRGSLHIGIKLGEFELDVRGIFACRRENRWVFRLPFGRAKSETGEHVSFPSISFADKSLNKELIHTIYEQAPSFIEGKDRVISLQDAKKSSCDIKPLENAKIATTVKKQALNEKVTKHGKHGLPNKTWVDIQPRNTAVRKKSMGVEHDRNSRL